MRYLFSQKQPIRLDSFGNNLKKLDRLDIVLLLKESGAIPDSFFLVIIPLFSRNLILSFSCTNKLGKLYEYLFFL